MEEQLQGLMAGGLGVVSESLIQYLGDYCKKSRGVGGLHGKLAEPVLQLL